MAKAEERIDALQELALSWTPEILATAGAVVYLKHDGSIEVERGLIRPEDVAETPETMAPAEPASPALLLPAKLISDLTAQKTAALRTALAQKPEIALAAVTHALARRAFYNGDGASCLDVVTKSRTLSSHIANPDECSGLFAFDAERGKWTDRLPGNADDLFAWCLTQSEATLLDLLAVSSAHMLDAVRDKGTRADAPSLVHAEALAQALEFDMTAWFTPTAANYFGRVNRSGIMDALADAGCAARTRSWSKLKKGELAVLAEQEIAGRGWLPQPLRPVMHGSVSSEADSMLAVAAE